MLIFLHIPKTAGVTLQHVLLREYGKRQSYRLWSMKREEESRRFLELPDADKARYRLLFGHFDYGIHEQVPGDSEYITILRDPVDRILSHYYYARANTFHPLHKTIHENGLSLTDYVRKGISSELDNGQVKALSARWCLPGTCTRECLDLALRNLESHFSVVGLTEQFDESLLVMKRALGWRRMPYYVVENRTEVRPARADVSKVDENVIREANQLDAELYEYARARLAREIAGYGPAFAEDLVRFRARNRWWSRGRLMLRKLHHIIRPQALERPRAGAQS